MKNMFRKILTVVCAVCVLAVGGVSAACKKGKDEGICVYMPDGAPALAFAQLMHEDTKDDGVTYRVVDASVIPTKVSAKDMADNADLCVLPVNAAAKSLGSGAKYQMLGLVTQGNMYLISNKDVGAVENVSALQGKTVGLAQISNVPGLTLKAALNRQGAEWQELTDGATALEDKVNLQPLASNAAIDGSLEYYLAAEPFVTTKTASGAFRVVGDLQALYNGVSGEVGYPQAVLVAKREFLENNKAWTENFLAKLSQNSVWLQTASAQTIYDAVVGHFEDENHKAAFGVQALTAGCVSRCGIKFAYARDCYTRVNEFLAELTAINANMAAPVENAFYWLG